ncbi:MAG TPA: lytic transglycosylase domain-containing protein [Myxococcota bacterium]|nr:lytic transglycosylase domain-containing protein [Myxococcota bacterium]
MALARAAYRALLTCSLLATAPAAGAGELYRYVDARGVIHITDSPTDARYERLVLSDFSRPRRGFGLTSFARSPAVSARDFDRLIAHTAAHHGLPPALVKAVIATESNFNATAVSAKGALGLMQLMPETADMLGVDPLRVDENVDGGTRYLRHLWDRFGDLTDALAAYNAGPESVDRYGGIPPYPETQQYVRRVLAYYRYYHGDFRP